MSNTTLLIKDIGVKFKEKIPLSDNINEYLSFSFTMNTYLVAIYLFSSNKHV
jgi:hypothetical protein